MIAVGMAAAGTVATILSLRAKRRTQGMIAAAQTLGFTYLNSNWPDLSRAPRPEMPLMTRGHRPRFNHIMIGSYGEIDTSIFDYSYTTGGKNNHRRTQTVFAFSQDLSLPLFQLRPENVLDEIGDLFLHRDIDFPSNPAFSRRYLLRGPDQDKIREMFSLALLNHFEGLPADRNWHVEGYEGTLIIYRAGKTVRPEDLPDHLNETSTLARMFFGLCGLNKAD